MKSKLLFNVQIDRHQKTGNVICFQQIIKNVVVIAFNVRESENSLATILFTCATLKTGMCVPLNFNHAGTQVFLPMSI